MSSIYDKSSLVLIPSGTKVSKVYSQKPVSGDGDFTFTRASAATRVNADGNIEKETQNLLLQSNNFGTTWTNGSSFEESGFAGYDGTNNAWKVTKTGAAGYIRQALSSGGVQTFSVYVKAAASNYVALYIASGTSASVWFNLTNGTTDSVNNAITSSIESVGNGWYRCSLTANLSLTDVRIYPAEAGSGVGATSGSLYIQDSQLEQGLVARDYQETTTAAVYGGITDNTPRLDYTDSSCPALLLEPQRTNLVTQGEYFKSWGKTSASVTSNAATSPEGVQNASKLVEASGSSFHFILSAPTIGSGAATFSFYAKAAERTSVSAFLSQSGNNGANFDLSAETATAQGTGNTASIESVGNGWYRCVVTNSGSAQIASQVRIGIQNGALDSYVGDGASGVYIYGAQVEAGSYATSYIPTYGSSVSRVAEASLKTGVADLINDGDGTLYMEVTPTNFEGDQRFGISDNIGANRIVLRLFNPSSFQLSCVMNSSVQVSIANSGYSAGNTYKIAGAWKNNDAVIYINGVQVATDTNCNITPSNPLTRISFDNGVGTAKWENPVSQTLYFPTRLSNEELAALTTI